MRVGTQGGPRDDDSEGEPSDWPPVGGPAGSVSGGCTIAGQPIFHRERAARPAPSSAEPAHDSPAMIWDGQSKGLLPASLALSCVPSFFDTKSLMHRCKMGPQPGPDGVRDAFCKIAPAEMARLYDPLLCKTAVTKSEPLSFKDGRVVWFWKGKGPQNLDSNQGISSKRTQSVRSTTDLFVATPLPFSSRPCYSPSAVASQADLTTCPPILS